MYSPIVGQKTAVYKVKTGMANTLFTPERVADAYSTSYDYDKTGNIQALTRRGHIGAIPDGTHLYGGGKYRTVQEMDGEEETGDP